MSFIITDIPPRELKERRIFKLSDMKKLLPLPDLIHLNKLSCKLENGLKTESMDKTEQACSNIVKYLSSFYKIDAPSVKVLGIRPRDFIKKSSNNISIIELHGDYHVKKMRIRVWMRTAIKKQPVKYRTLLNTLLHEFCHHLDLFYYNFYSSPHTRGFFERISRLYFKTLGEKWVRPVWKRLPKGNYYMAFSVRRAKRYKQI